MERSIDTVYLLYIIGAFAVCAGAIIVAERGDLAGMLYRGTIKGHQQPIESARAAIRKRARV
jgi:hypothetical protein